MRKLYGPPKETVMAVNIYFLITMYIPLDKSESFRYIYQNYRTSVS